MTGRIIHLSAAQKIRSKAQMQQLVDSYAKEHLKRRFGLYYDFGLKKIYYEKVVRGEKKWIPTGDFEEQCLTYNWISLIKATKENSYFFDEKKQENISNLTELELDIINSLYDRANYVSDQKMSCEYDEQEYGLSEKQMYHVISAYAHSCSQEWFYRKKYVA